MIYIWWMVENVGIGMFVNVWVKIEFGVMMCNCEIKGEFLCEFIVKRKL